FVYRPQLLMLDPSGERSGWLAILIAFALVALGTLPLAAALAGHWRRPLSLAPRFLLLVPALALFWPAGGGLLELPVAWINLLGVALLGVTLAALGRQRDAAPAKAGTASRGG
ncbi:MAG: hypothetical protein AAGN46_15410, partial [Acidobacteriota bacterium]